VAWQELFIGVGGAGGVTAAALRVLRSRKVRRLASDVLDGDDRPDALHELKVILEEQRSGYTHLAVRVARLEADVADLSRRLVEARKREKTLETLLRSERRDATARIGQLEHELSEARIRITELERLLAEAQKGA
jgi:predicted  nucleic acid-binding Zn-ribbon protein